MTLSETSVVVATRAQVSVDLGEETAIMGMGSGRYYGVRDVAARAWTLLQEPTSIEAMAATIEAEYEVQPDQLRRDLVAFVTSLVDEGLVTVTGTGT